MKKIMVLCCAILFLLSVGCKATSKEGVAETEKVSASAEMIYHPEIWAQTNLGNNSFVELESGCYYQSGEWIYFIPRGEAQSYPLCSKPNCTHDDSNCNAYCGWRFGYYNGHLYSISVNITKNNFPVVQMNLDGTEHKTVCEAEIDVDGAFEFTFHDGKIFILIWGDAEILEEARDQLLMVDLSDYTQTELFEDYFAKGNRMVIQQIFDNKIYGYSDTYMTRGENCNKMEWNITTGSVRQVAEGIIPGGYVSETTFYYVEPNAGFRECDLATGEIKDCGLPVEDAFWARRDEDYIYLLGNARNGGTDYTLYFLTWDYELVDQVELTDNTFYGYVASDRLYFINNKDNEFQSITHYIDKADIGSGYLELKEMK